MKRWLQRLAMAGGTLLILVVVFVMAEHARGRWQLSRYLAGLEARGEVLSVPALEPQRPPAEENRALNLIAWSNRDSDLLAALRMAADLPAYDSGFDYRKGFVDFQLAGVINVKRAAQFLHIARMPSVAWNSGMS